LTDASDDVIAARQYAREKLAGRRADPSALLAFTEDLSPYVTGGAVNTEAVDRWVEANSTAKAPSNGRVPSQGQRGPVVGGPGTGGVAEAEKRFGNRRNGAQGND
jgi:hypothetical protein